jgi:hypothetical protein
VTVKRFALAAASAAVLAPMLVLSWMTLLLLDVGVQLGGPTFSEPDPGRDATGAWQLATEGTALPLGAALLACAAAWPARRRVGEALAFGALATLASAWLVSGHAWSGDLVAERYGFPFAWVEDEHVFSLAYDVHVAPLLGTWACWTAAAAWALRVHDS